MHDDLHIDQGGARKRLVVYLHGFRVPVAKDHALGRMLPEVVDDADLFLPLLPYRRLGSTVGLAQLAARLLREIDELWEARQRALGEPYEEVLLVGHSTGAVLTRKLFVCARGEVVRTPAGGAPRVEAPFEEELAEFREPRVWAGHVRRVVLLAAMSRGWTVEGVRSRTQAFLWSLGALYGHLKPGRVPTIFDIRRGAPFIVQTRLQWLALMGTTSPRKPEGVLVVQLLGTRDDLVAPDDNLDFVVDRGDVFFMLVPNSTHAGIIRVDESAERRECLRAALVDDADELREKAVPRSRLSDQLPSQPDASVKEAVFVMHGIRDLGHWTQKIAAEIKRAGEAKYGTGTAVRSLTPSYGFFAMLPFLFPWVRRAKVEWLMDRYVEARAMYPEAEFSYVGHSNGTYLLARALQDYPALRVRHVVFAGSVVRSDYRWGRLLDEGRVEKVLNYVATDDKVVAGIPHGLRLIASLDLGGAGHTGFDAEDERVTNVRYVRGAHSAGLVESQWDEIAAFVLDGRAPEAENSDYDERQSEPVQVLASLSPLLLLGAAAGVVYGVALLVRQAFGVDAHLVGALWALACFAAIGMLKTILTRL